MNKSVIEYYTDKIKKHGPNSQGVDWNGKDSQYLRFDILSNIFRDKSNFSLLDYGCGYGELLSYLHAKDYKNIKYMGFDLSNEMLSQASKKHKEGNFINKIPNNFKVDYAILSGTLHIKLKISESKWKNHVLKTLNHLNQITDKGFSFNLLTSYSDEEYKKDRLYYASPEYIFSYCKQNFSKDVLLDHSYGLYEFTVFVKK